MIARARVLNLIVTIYYHLIIYYSLRFECVTAIVVAGSLYYIAYLCSCMLTVFLPYLSLRLPQNVELNIIPRNTIVVVRACWYLQQVIRYDKC